MSAQSGSSLAQVFNPLVVGDNTENSGVWLLTIIKKKKKKVGTWRGQGFPEIHVN